MDGRDGQARLEGTDEEVDVKQVLYIRIYLYPPKFLSTCIFLTYVDL